MGLRNQEFPFFSSNSNQMVQVENHSALLAQAGKLAAMVPGALSVHCSVEGESVSPSRGPGTS